MSGYISDLETFDWMPEAFDAFLYTPPGDRSKHRISQRAVTNLSSIGGGSGGGVAAVLQGGFLRFFDDFGYDRLGPLLPACERRLRDGRRAAGAGGYYIVKGAGLPRINVIGARRGSRGRRSCASSGRSWSRKSWSSSAIAALESVQDPFSRRPRAWFANGQGVPRRNPCCAGSPLASRRSAWCSPPASRSTCISGGSCRKSGR
jgi:hypothetical protein